MKSKDEYLEQMKDTVIPANEGQWKMIIEILLDIRELSMSQVYSMEVVREARESEEYSTDDVRLARAEGGDNNGSTQE